MKIEDERGPEIANLAVHVIKRAVLDITKKNMDAKDKDEHRIQNEAYDFIFSGRLERFLEVFGITSIEPTYVRRKVIKILTDEKERKIFFAANKK